VHYIVKEKYLAILSKVSLKSQVLLQCTRMYITILLSHGQP